MMAKPYKSTLTNWLCGKLGGYEFNPSKCQVVQVTGSKKPVHFNYRFHGHVIETVTCAKYLVVDISSSLIWNSHIDRITGNANKLWAF